MGCCSKASECWSDVLQVDVIDAELLKPWERKRQEYKQRKKVRHLKCTLPAMPSTILDCRMTCDAGLSNDKQHFGYTIYSLLDPKPGHKVNGKCSS